MGETTRTTSEEARRVGDEIGVDWDRFDLEQFRFGMDVELEHGSLLVRDSKGSRSRHVPLQASTVAALDGYLARRDELLPRPSSPALFLSCAGTRLRHGNLHTVFARLLKRVGLPPQPRPRLRSRPPGEHRPAID